MSQKSKADHLSADIATIDSLLAGLSADDAVQKYTLSIRRKIVADELRKLSASPAHSANVVLFFDGAPVHGTHGIDSSFVSPAVLHYEKLVHGLAKQHITSGMKRPLMLVTDVVRGSFGIEFQELHESFAVDSPLSLAVERASQLIALAASDADTFADAMSDVDPDAQSSLKNFLGTLKKHSATLRTVSEKSEHDFTGEQISLAHHAVYTLGAREYKAKIVGIFGSALPYKRTFDFQPDNGAAISGTIVAGVDPKGLLKYALKRCVVGVSVQVRSAGEKVNSKYQLTDIEPEPKTESKAVSAPRSRKRSKA